METKTKIKIEDVISDLKELFEVGEITATKSSYSIEKEFNIDKRVFERFQVLDMLAKYFKDKVIDGGYLEVSPITFTHTKFEIKEGPPK
jgi:hypothetical protein